MEESWLVIMLDRVNYNTARYVNGFGANGYPGLQKTDGNKDQVETADNEFIKVDFSEKALKRLGLKKCEACEQRKYQDESNDPGVSFKAPTHLSPEQAASAVTNHEQEHVSHEQANARAEGKEIIYQSVKIYTDSCPECGRIYVSGGETTTMTKTKPKPKQNQEAGQVLDILA